jgi:hypothetical protein
MYQDWMVQGALDDDRHRVTDEQRHRRALPAAQPPDEGPLNQHPEHEHHRHRDEQA